MLIRFRLGADVKAGLHARICRRGQSVSPTVSGRESYVYFDSTPICENENRTDLKNLLHCSRFLDVGPILSKKPPCQSKCFERACVKALDRHFKLKSQKIFPLGFHVGPRIGRQNRRTILAPTQK